jgi:hypothetical protein
MPSAADTGQTMPFRVTTALPCRQSPQQIPDRPAEYGQCQILPDGVGTSRVVTSGVAG